MAFARPTLAELVDRITQDLASRMSLSSPILRRSVVYILARVMAGAAHMLHGHLEFLARQMFPDRSDGDYLVRQAGLFGLSKTPAAYATGSAIVVGTVDTAIPVGTVMQRADGAECAVTTEATIAALSAWVGSTAYAVGDLRTNASNVFECITAGTSASSGGPTGTAADITDGTAHWRYVAAGSAAVLAAVSMSEAGQDGNTTAASPLSLQSPTAGANTASSVAVGGLSGGADEETDEELSVRLIERMQSPPHGGNAADYVAWAKEVAGVTRAWCYPLEGGEGKVVVRFVRDNDAVLIPDAGEVAAVQTHIDAARPVTADVTVAAPVAEPIDYTIALTPDTTATRAAVTAQLQDLLLSEAEPGGPILLSHIRNAIHDADGVTNYVLTTPSADVTRATGQLATHGEITWA